MSANEKAPQLLPRADHAQRRRCFVLCAAALICLLHVVAPVALFYRLSVSRNHLTFAQPQLCQDVGPIPADEFAARRSKLAQMLASDGMWNVYVSEPSSNTLYYLNVSSSDWSLSERPWLFALSADNEANPHISILAPAFEVSRSKRLPMAVNKSKVSWVAWEEAQDPFQVMMDHLIELHARSGHKRSWQIALEENVRQFVASGLDMAADRTQGGATRVHLARLAIRELRMRKSKAELAIQRCAARSTLEALRAARKHLRIGMTELEADRLIRKYLTSAGLTDLETIVLFGENAALPHASASSKRLEKGEFVLMDVGGTYLGYRSDITRTMLPDSRLDSFSWLFKERSWPSESSRSVWHAVKRAQEAALRTLETKEPVEARSIDSAARNVIAQAGYKGSFTHRLGHGIGIQTHEAPYLNSGNAQTIIPDETFSNEPGIYYETGPAWGHENGIGVRLEDMVRKTVDGWELLHGETLAALPWQP